MVSNLPAWPAATNPSCDRMHHVTSQGSEALLRLVETLRPLDARSSVLDSGAGNGALTGLLAQKSSAMSIIATDISSSMLKNLRARKIPNVTTLILDATKDHVSQGLPPRSFSHALSTFTLQLLASPQRAVNEMYRVLAPGGVVGLANWKPNEVVENWNTACKNLDPDFVPNDAAFSNSCHDCEGLGETLQRAGFVDVRTEEARLEIVYDTAEECVDYYLTAKSPALSMMQSTWKGEVEDVRQELTKVIRERYGDGRVGMVAACAVGRRPLETPSP